MNFPLAACFYALFSVVILQSISPVSEKFKGYINAAASLAFFILFFKTATPLFDLFQNLTAKTENGAVFFRLMTTALSLCEAKTVRVHFSLLSV